MRIVLILFGFFGWGSVFADGIPAPTRSAPRIELRIHRQVVVRTKDIAAASAVEDASNWGVLIKLNPAATRRFASATKANLGKQMEIVLDGMTLSAPKISAVIDSGSIQLSNAFSKVEAQELVNRITAALPSVAPENDRTR